MKINALSRQVARLGGPLALLLGGCVSSSYYLPTDPSLAIERSAGCTGALYGYANLPLAGGRPMQLTLAPKGTSIELSAQVKLLPGQKLRLAEPSIVMHESAAGGRAVVVRLGPWESVVHGVRGVVLHRDFSDARGWIEGKAFQDHEEAARSYAFNLFTIKGSVLAPKAEEYRVTVPPLEVDNIQLPARTFDVRLHEHTRISGCLQ